MKTITRLLLMGIIFLIGMLPTLTLAAVIFGNPKGEITLVEYFDYDCPVCRGYAAVIDALAKRNANLRVVQRVIPIVSPRSQVVDRSVLASFMLGRFSEMQVRIIHSGYTETIPPAAVDTIARSIHLDVPHLVSEMQSRAVTEQLKQNLILYEKTHQRIVPVLIFYRAGHPLDRIQINGAAPYEKLQAVIEQLKSKAHVSEK